MLAYFNRMVGSKSIFSGYEAVKLDLNMGMFQKLVP